MKFRARSIRLFGLFHDLSMVLPTAASTTAWRLTPLILRFTFVVLLTFVVLIVLRLSSTSSEFSILETWYQSPRFNNY
ncbi:hypothetical protein HanRHA438_Chr16g0783051 [Helianthus annuus]|nr:hypothetical protein HanRHA438_Chr16g0783051 [Helianthus annuus]